jgi:hypothetical protein
MTGRFLSVLSLLCFVSFQGSGQWYDPVENLLKRVNTEERVPEDLLAKKSVLLYDPQLQGEYLDQIQASFQKTGIDVVLDYPLDIPASNDDVNSVFVRAMSARDVRFLILFRQVNNQLEFLFTAFNRKADWADPGQPAWRVTGNGLSNLLESINRVASASQKKKNHLIIERPEMELNLDPVTGNRNEFFSLDLKVDKLAVIRSGQKETDDFLETYLTSVYPFKFKMFDAGTEETTARGEGYLYVVKLIHCRSSAAMDLLGYDLSNVGHRINSVSYKSGKPEEASLPSEQTVFKFYFKHLENGNIYLGTKWDGAADWKEALNNYIQGFRAAADIR